MSTDRDTTRIVRSWLEEGRTTLPDWVRDDVFDRLPATPQRRSRGTAWRFLTMPTLAKAALAAAAVIVVAVGALAFLQRPTGPAATPTPSPTLTAAPSVGIRMMPRLGLVPPGTYRMGEEASIVLTVPSGWTGSAGDMYAKSIGTDLRKHRDQPGELQVWVDASDGIKVYPSVCGSDPRPVGPTVDDFVTALRAQEGSETSDPVDVTIGGRVVQRFEISFGQGVDFATCADGIARVSFSEAYGYIATSEPTTATVYMVQTDAGRIVFGFGHTDDATDADIAELDAMVESMVIEP
jgi:hypothetical protein